MEIFSLSLFDTALGRCGIAWGPAGIRATSFPHEDDAVTLAYLRKRARGAAAASAPDALARVIDDIVALFGGEPRDLAYAALDLEGVGQFVCGVYEQPQAFKPGSLTTYGGFARALGDVALSQRVGQALGRNPFPIIVPCHRIVGASGAMTGFSAPGGTDLKRRLLKIEGALAPDLFD